MKIPNSDKVGLSFLITSLLISSIGWFNCICCFLPQEATTILYIVGWSLTLIGSGIIFLKEPIIGLVKEIKELGDIKKK